LGGYPDASRAGRRKGAGTQIVTGGELPFFGLTLDNAARLRPLGREERAVGGLAQADAGETLVCRDYAKMVDKLLDLFRGLRFPFRAETRLQLQAMERPAAWRILETVSRFGKSGVGDVSPLHSEWQGYFRLRCGDYRLILWRTQDEIEVIAVSHRSEIEKLPHLRANSRRSGNAV
jgi:mRNA-degrading endonuclease RelE of RelBE toxin-antitoxin system